jgi:anti-anti-sigma factor
MRLADLRFDLRGRVVVARLDGELDMSNADELGAALAQRMPNEAQGLVLDLSRLSYMDSAGIQLVYELLERLKDRGQQMRLVVPRGCPVSHALHLANVPRTVGVVESPEAGFASMGFSGDEGRPGGAGG